MDSIVRFEHDGRARVGALVGDEVVDLGDVAPEAADGLEVLLEGWARFTAEAQTACVDPARARFALGDVRLLAPFVPTNIFLTFANYYDHLLQVGGQAAFDNFKKTAPFLFQVPATIVTGANDTIVLSSLEHNVDWEGELAVIIGAHAEAVSVDDALGVVAGYSVINDVSVRGDAMYRGPANKFADFILMKGRPTFKPFGPGITPAGAVPDPQTLQLQTIVNGVTKQDSNTKEMIFSVAEQVSWLSHQLPLVPGDLIATGSPAGVGVATGEFLHAGDVVEVRIDGVGSILNPIAAPNQ